MADRARRVSRPQIAFSGKVLKQDNFFGLQHAQTKTWLSTNSRARFPNPIRNHAEVRTTLSLSLARSLTRSLTDALAR